MNIEKMDNISKKIIDKSYQKKEYELDKKELSIIHSMKEVNEDNSDENE